MGLVPGDESSSCFYKLELSDRPADYVTLEVDRANRLILLYDVNGALFHSTSCPAVAAGARPEDLR